MPTNEIDVKRIEQIFSQAALLHQAGRLRNTIYCIGRKVLILNQDSTVLMQFRLFSGQGSFDEPISFAANDYESGKFATTEDGKVVFQVKDKDWVRTKTCRAPAMDPKDVVKLFKQLDFESENSVVIQDSIIDHLDQDLSHIEFSVDGGQLIVTQRNIYSGSVIKIKKAHRKGLTSLGASRLDDMEPIGVRTNDFISLYAYAPSLRFTFGPNVIKVSDERQERKRIEAIISQCKYDELGKETESHGRKKQKKRRSK